MKRQWGEMNRKSRRTKPNPVLWSSSLFQWDFVQSKQQRAQWLTPVSIAIKHKENGVRLLACHNHRLKEDLMVKYIYSGPLATRYRYSSVSVLYTVMAWPSFILSWPVWAAAPSVHILPIHGHRQYCSCNDKGHFVCFFMKTRCRDKKQTGEENGSQKRSTARNEPRAMNPINSVMWELMLLLLRAGVWIIEIRAAAKCGGTANCKWSVI